MTRELLGGRVVLSRQMGTVALVDVVAIALFIALGELRHAGTLVGGFETFLQFLIGWLVAAVVIRAYTPSAVANEVQAAIIGIPAWVIAALIGQLVRILTDPMASFAPSFVLVSIGAGGILLVGGRILMSIR